MADHNWGMMHDKLSREIAEFALYALKNRVERISQMPVSEQDQIKGTICSAARMILQNMHNWPSAAQGGGNGGA